MTLDKLFALCHFKAFHYERPFFFHKITPRSEGFQVQKEK